LNEEFLKRYTQQRILKQKQNKRSIKEEMTSIGRARAVTSLQDQIYHYILDETHMDFRRKFNPLAANRRDTPKRKKKRKQISPAISQPVKMDADKRQINQDNNLNVTNEELRDYMK